MEALAKALNISKDTVDWVTFFDLAYIAKGKIPSDIISSSETNKYLPLVFRTVRGGKLTQQKLKKLTKLLNES